MTSPSSSPILTSKKERLYVQLGLGSATLYGVTGGAAMLDFAAAARLPVPTGLILIDEAYRRALGSGLIRVKVSGQVTCPNPTALIVALRLPNTEWEFPGPYEVRAGSSLDDGVTAQSVNQVNVDAAFAESLADALCAAWQAASAQGDDTRRDVLITRQVKAKTAGIALIEQGFEDDLIEIEQEGGDPIMLPGLCAGEPASADSQPWTQRLQCLLRDTRRAFNRRGFPTNWAIRWADDGECCWLVETHPLQQTPPRSEQFIPADCHHLLPDPSTPFKASLIAACADDLFAAYRRLDRSLPTSRPLIKMIEGEACLNLSLLVDVMRRFGQPTAPLAARTNCVPERDYPRHPRRLIANLLPTMRLLITREQAPGAARQTAALIRQRMEQPGVSIDNLLKTARWVFTASMNALLWLDTQRGAEEARRELRDAAQRGLREVWARLTAHAERAFSDGVLPDSNALWQRDIHQAALLDLRDALPDDDEIEASHPAVSG